MTRYEWLKQQVEYFKQHPTYGCVEWPYGRTSGYGILRVGGQQVTAHRVAYAVHHGREPGVNVNHICANRACFNPEHLYAGTQEENLNDIGLAERYGVNGVIPPEKIADAKAAIERFRGWFEIGDEDIYRDAGRTEIMGLMEKEDTPELSLLETIESLASALTDAKSAFETLAPDALGIDTRSGYSYRDELLTKIDEALARTWSHLPRRRREER